MLVLCFCVLSLQHACYVLSGCVSSWIARVAFSGLRVGFDQRVLREGFVRVGFDQRVLRVRFVACWVCLTRAQSVYMVCIYLYGCMGVHFLGSP